MVSTVGIPAGRSALFTSNTGPHAAQVQVYLDTPDRRKRSDVEIVAALRPRFAGQFPGTVTYFNLGGIVSRVLNRGSQNPLEVEVLGYDFADAQVAAREVARVMRDVPGVVGRAGEPRGELPAVQRRRGPREGRHRRPLAAGRGPGRPLLAQLERQREPFDLHGPAHGQPVQHRRAARRAVSREARGPGQDLRDPLPAGGPWSSRRSPRSSGAWRRSRSSGSTSSA